MKKALSLAPSCKTAVIRNGPQYALRYYAMQSEFRKREASLFYEKTEIMFHMEYFSLPG